MIPIMLAAAILNPADMGSSLTPEQFMNGMEFIFESAKKNGLNQESVMTQLTNFRNKLDIWNKDLVWVSCGNAKPTVWWKTFYGHTDIGNIAETILSTPLTSATTERSFSTSSHIHSKKKNRLTTDRAAKITYIAHNYKCMNPIKNQPMNDNGLPEKRLRVDESVSDND